MADLGAKGEDRARLYTAERDVPPITVHPFVIPATDTNPLSFDVTGVISGVIQIGGVAAAGVRVALLYRSSFQIVKLAVTDGSGAYSFTGLDKNDVGEYMALAEDPQFAPTYNYTLARDHLTAG